MNELLLFLDKLLVPEEFARADISMNGLQVAGKSAAVTKAAFAVDACMESFSAAVKAGADILIVHHGLYWGKPIPITGAHFERISFLIEHDLALYASHLPLDAHPEVGNNAGLAAALGLKSRMPFGEYHGVDIGIKGSFDGSGLTLQEVIARLDLTDEPGLSVLPFGPDKIHTVGVVSGGAPNEVLQAIEEDLDLFITGEPSHQVYHTCLEAGISMIAGGHYLTETYGPKLLMDRVAAGTGIETVFIDIPTGL